MTPPDTNLETQTRRHRGPLVGMLVVVVFAVGIIFYWLVAEVEQAETNDQTTPTTEPPVATPGEGAPATGGETGATGAAPATR
ncbi:hypothetical protein [Frigidibacter sp. SD6-1]|uniref:hypothetical protein n=1 Tax=Frigidibacter sp. SD6-1 TaxID=3032581 RepID=UPI0024DF9BA2|nr:hypothetical protein [Frigidibacter sp. SD6-1]